MFKKYFLGYVLFLLTGQLSAQAPTITSFTPTSARTNASVTINGTNFTGATAVSFGGTPANAFFVSSSIKITAFVGPGSSGSVSVTTPAGTASLPGFTYLPPPVITSFLPASGGYGTTVNIKGVNFTGATAVRFGGILATSYTILSDTTINAVVSNGSSGSVTVTSANGTGSLAGFTYTGPVITSFTPTSGVTGTNVSITGLNFTGTTAVSFGGLPAASFTVNSPTSITAEVGAVGGPDTTGTITVSAPDGTATIQGFNTPYITSVTPNNGGYGAAITIRGFNFSGATAVTFGGVNAASYSIVSDTVINATVGYGLSGAVKVRSATGVGTWQTFFYSYPLPVINSFTPISGSIGTVVTIRGTGFSGATSVSIAGSFLAPYTVVSDSVITSAVSTTNSGSVIVNTPGGGASLPGFTYTGPVISSFSPQTGITGTTISIFGTNLSGATAVSFGGTAAASFTVIGSTQIDAVVGSGSSGSIVVTTPAGTITASGFKMIPIITSFSPEAGPVGTSVTISGVNFNPVAANNIVFFGAVRATVLSASATQLVVTVPAGFTPEPISVTTGSVSAYSNKPFTVTFPNDNATLSTNSFSPATEYYGAYFGSGYYGVNNSAISDIDGDGKPDMIILKSIFTTNNYAFSVFRNTSTGGVSSFAPRVNFAQYLDNGSGILCKDLDGDGKPDIAITFAISPTGYVAVFRNTSTPGNISFASRVDFPMYYSPGPFCANDIDGDGKPELIIPNTNGGSFVSILKNNSSAGTISFSPRVDYNIPNSLASVAVNDLNDDGKPDIALNSSSGSGTIFVMKNTSSPGSISFAATTDYPSAGAGGISCYDMDSDGKTDIISSSGSTNYISVLRNTSIGGNISFAPKVDFPSGTGTNGLAVGDMDGDGKADALVGNYIVPGNYDDSVSVFKNTSTTGNISFAPRAMYRTGDWPSSVYIGDLNLDGKADMVTANWIGYSLSAFINKIGDSVITTLCPPTAGTTLTADLTGSSYQWQADNGSGFADINDGGNINGATTASLQLTSIPSSWNGRKYRCRVNSNYSIIHTLRFENTWTGAVSTAWEDPANWSCGAIPDANTNVVINSGTVVINTSTTIRSLRLGPGVNFTVSTGVILTIINP